MSGVLEKLWNQSGWRGARGGWEVGDDVREEIGLTGHPGT